MYIVPAKTIIVEGLKQTFDASYPEPDFRNIHVDIEYPVDPQNYPSIWVDYDDTQDVTRAGIDHHETVDPVSGNTRDPFTRYKFGGYISLTMVALTSLERDRLFDEVVRVVAFGHEDSILGRFWNYVQTNDLIAMNMNTDKIQPRGAAAAPGTPWGTDELMYERSLNLELIGEFIPNAATNTLTNLSKIQLDTPSIDLTGDLGYPATGSGFNQWH